MGESYPLNLGRDGIEQRLVWIREAARARRLDGIAGRFERLHTKSADEIASSIRDVLAWLKDKPEYRRLAAQLEVVAGNLKNLKR